LHLVGILFPHIKLGSVAVQFHVKHMLPQHCETYNDIFLLITSTKV